MNIWIVGLGFVVLGLVFGLPSGMRKDVRLSSNPKAPQG